jgi:hypothetical protein
MRRNIDWKDKGQRNAYYREYLQRLRDHQRALGLNTKTGAPLRPAFFKQNGHAKDCPACGETRLEAFNHARKRDGTVIYRCYCRKCETKKSRAYVIRRDFNLTVAEYDSLMHEAICALCGRHDDLVLDHSHEKRDIRGVLCVRCNLDVAAVEKLHVDGNLTRVISYLKCNS